MSKDIKMAIITLKGAVNTEALKQIDNSVVDILNAAVTPENIRTKLKWHSFTDLNKPEIKGDSSDEYIELVYKAEVKTDFVSNLVQFITQPFNGSRRFSLDSNPAVVKIKSRVEDILDSRIDDNDVLKDLINSNGAYLLYDVDVAFKDPSVTIDNVIVITLTVSINQRD